MTTHRRHRLHSWLALRRATAYFLFFLAVTPGLAMESGFSLAIGRGTCLTDAKLRSLLFSPAVTWQVEETKLFLVSFEGNVEFLDNGRFAGWIAGAGPYCEFTPVIDDFEPILGLGLGVNYVSQKAIGGRALGSNVLFGETALLGLSFEVRQTRFRISYLFRHLSNAGFSVENDGINFHYMVLSVSP